MGGLMPVGRGGGWSNGVEPPRPCLAPQALLRVGMGGRIPQNPNPTWKPLPGLARCLSVSPLAWALQAAGPARRPAWVAPGARRWPSWLLGQVAHAPRQGKGTKCAEMPSQEGATSATLPPGSWDSGQRLDGVGNVSAQNGRVGRSCWDCRAAEGGTGRDNIYDIMYVCQARDCWCRCPEADAALGWISRSPGTVAIYS